MTALLAFGALDGFAHQVRNHGAFVLSLVGDVKRFLDVVGNAEIHGSRDSLRMKKVAGGTNSEPVQHPMTDRRQHHQGGNAHHHPFMNAGTFGGAAFITHFAH